jgi:putative flippase GtrA
MLISGTCVDLFVKNLMFNEILAKIIVDGVLFILNFVIQREFIFKNKKAGV